MRFEILATEVQFIPLKKQNTMKYLAFLLALMIVSCENISDGGTGETSGGAEETTGGTEESSSKPDWATNGETIYSLSGEPLFVVAKADIPKVMKWEEAKLACENLGNGWRLPDKDELSSMHAQLHNEGKGNFKSENDAASWYWSSSQDDSGDAFAVNFTNGYVDYGDYDILSGKYYGQVRAVRALP